MLWKWSLYLYKKLCLSALWKRLVGDREYKNMQNLILLHPGADAMQLLTEYHVEKIRWTLLILLIGIGMTVCIRISEGADKSMLSENGIIRPQRETEMILEARVIGDNVDFVEEMVVDIRETMLMPKEAEQAFADLVNLLEARIWCENPSAQEVVQDLDLPEYVDGYPFLLSWDSSNHKLLDSAGKVYAEEMEAEEEVTLTVETVYDGRTWEYSWQVKLLPPDRTIRQQLLYDLKKEMIHAEELQKYEEEVSLPTQIGDHRIRWSVKGENTEGLILVLTFVTAATVYGLKDRDLQDEVLERRKKMKREYPMIVSKYALFLEAGMTVRGAFVKINQDYQKRKNVRGNPVYEEMNYACNELKAGVSEYKVYEHFARRVGVPEYTRLCALLSQNLKKGNTALAARLREESEKALAEDIQDRKRQGEEAGTKLLAPIGMLLILVLVMVMLPAFSSLG